jgi:4'-phosphopantetheinyl transferase
MPPRINPGHVHVWRFALDPPAVILQSLEHELTPEEVRRADRFRTEALRRRFVTGRACLRRILGHYLDREPGSLEFVYGPHGKPALADDGGRFGIEFNLAHSHGVALCAVTPDRAIGVDLEGHRALETAEQIIRRFFSPAECAAFLALTEAERPAAFFRAWARKEAFLKAVGTGLSTALESFDVSLGPHEPAALLRIGDDPSEPLRWWLGDLDAGPGFAAALVVARSDRDPEVWIRELSSATWAPES